MIHRAAVALGSNLGDRRAALEAALTLLASADRLLATSAFIETEPVGGVAEGRFLNAACIIETARTPLALLERLLEIERSLGRDRTREQRWGSRTLDLDLLLYDDVTMDEDGLTLPHPRLHERLFVLEPLAEIAPDWMVGRSRTVRDLRDALRRAEPPA
ncbi:MAG: 2-amino-4-hydroxy-6-hydroxymethyldihydropteridine diphosphokinase [Planctomycetota bacterium]|nr:2-amino-4-hydroxy-6-hydroxymethyldihydropteridine diphosphokinase [Planctomycetota bacterium]